MVVNIALGGDSEISTVLVALEIFVLSWVIFAAFSHRAAKRTIPRVLTDHRTIRWTYSPQEWQRFSAQQWRRSIRINLTITGFSLVVGVVSMVIAVVCSNGVFEISWALAIGAGIVAMIGVLLFGQSTLLLLWRRRQTTLYLYLSPPNRLHPERLVFWLELEHGWPKKDHLHARRPRHLDV
jgi:hypothetical protein